MNPLKTRQASEGVANLGLIYNTRKQMTQLLGFSASNETDPCHYGSDLSEGIANNWPRNRG